MPTVRRAATMTEWCHGSKYAGMDDQPRPEGYNHPKVATAPSAVKMVPDIANQGSLSLGGVSSCGCFGWSFHHDGSLFTSLGFRCF